MRKISLNHDWLFAGGTIGMMELFMGSDEKIKSINLPHDAMICQERTRETANAHQTGFYPGGTYTYIKKWEVPAEWEGQTVALEFEGVADTCRIYMNGDLAAEHYNPYTGIFVDVTTSGERTEGGGAQCGTVQPLVQRGGIIPYGVCMGRKSGSHSCAGRAYYHAGGGRRCGNRGGKGTNLQPGTDDL